VLLVLAVLALLGSILHAVYTVLVVFSNRYVDRRLRQIETRKH
jgi:hypothetical protein